MGNGIAALVNLGGVPVVQPVPAESQRLLEAVTDEPNAMFGEVW
jgi:hypothetical protein